MTLLLEGKVIGPWVKEFDKAWRSLADSLGSRKLRVDLRDLTQMDADGRVILAEIYKTTGAEFLADTPMTRFFAEEAQKSGKEKV